MNWEAIGAIGEIVGAIAVVITLLYLASQTKQNTKATHAQATASVASEMEQALLVIAQNDVLSGAFLKASQRQGLSELESIRLGFWWSAFVRSAHSHLIQDDLGNLSEDNKTVTSKILRSFVSVPFLRLHLESLVEAELYPEDFCNWVKKNVLSESTSNVT